MEEEDPKAGGQVCCRIWAGGNSLQARFLRGLRLRGAIKLDASPLDLKPLEDFHEENRTSSD